MFEKSSCSEAIAPRFVASTPLFHATQPGAVPCVEHLYKLYYFLRHLHHTTKLSNYIKRNKLNRGSLSTVASPFHSDLRKIAHPTHYQKRQTSERNHSLHIKASLPKMPYSLYIAAVHYEWISSAQLRTFASSQVPSGLLLMSTTLTQSILILY